MAVMKRGKDDCGGGWGCMHKGMIIIKVEDDCGYRGDMGVGDDYEYRGR